MDNQNFDLQNNNQTQVRTGKGLCIAGMVLGIISLVFVYISLLVLSIGLLRAPGFVSLVFVCISLIISIIGLVLSAVGRKRAKLANTSTGIGTAGLVLSIIGLSLATIVLILIVSALVVSILSNYYYVY